MNELTMFLTKSSFRLRKTRKLRFDYILVIVGLVLSVAVVCTAMCLFEGYQKALERTLLDCNSHLLVTSDTKPYLTITETTESLKKLKNLPYIRSAVPVYSNVAMLQIGAKIRSSLIRAYPNGIADPWYKDYVLNGSSTQHKGVVIIGNTLASDIGAGINDHFTLQYPKPENYGLFGIIPNKKEFKIGGIIKTGYHELDKSIIIMNSADAWDFYGTPPNYTHLEVNFFDKFIKKTNELTKQVNSILGTGYYLQSWIDLNGNLFYLITMEKWLIFLVFSLLILIAAINCISTVTTSIIDNRKEIALLRSIGLSIKRIRSVFYYRLLSLSLASIVSGLVIGTGAAWVITKQELYRLKGEVYFIDKISMQISPANYSAVIVLSLLVVVLCIRIPLNRIDRLDIISVIRGY